MAIARSKALEGEQLLQAINRHVFLVMLHIRWPKMSYQIADAVVEVTVMGEGNTEEKKEIGEEFRTKPQWQLMPEEWRKKLTNLEGRARSLVAHASIQFASRGMAVLPVTRAQDIFSGLRTLRAELEQYRDEFVEEYENILESLSERLDEDLLKKVRGKLPDVEQVAKKFSLVWAIIPAGGRGGATAEQLDTLERALIQSRDRLLGKKIALPRVVHNAFVAMEDMKREASTGIISDGEAGELITEARNQMHQFTREMLQDMVREPRRMLTDAADNLLAALKDPKRSVRNGTIGQVRDAFEMLEGFEFLAGPDLVESIRTCRERLDNVTPQQLNSDAEIGARLAAGLQGVRDEAADSQSAANAVRQFRGIKLRDKSKNRPQAAAAAV